MSAASSGVRFVRAGHGPNSGPFAVRSRSRKGALALAFRPQPRAGGAAADRRAAPPGCTSLLLYVEQRKPTVLLGVEGSNREFDALFDIDGRSGKVAIHGEGCVTEASASPKDAYSHSENACAGFGNVADAIRDRQLASARLPTVEACHNVHTGGVRPAIRKMVDDGPAARCVTFCRFRLSRAGERKRVAAGRVLSHIRAASECGALRDLDEIPPDCVPEGARLCERNRGDRRETD